MYLMEYWDYQDSDERLEETFGYFVLQFRVSFHAVAVVILIAKNKVKSLLLTYHKLIKEYVLRHRIVDVSVIKVTLFVMKKIVVLRKFTFLNQIPYSYLLYVLFMLLSASLTTTNKMLRL